MARILVTGASGFVGRWLRAELEGAGHEVTDVDLPIDVRDERAIADIVVAARPDAIAHLAAVSFAPDAANDPTLAFSVAIAGTTNVMEAARTMDPSPAVLVVGSSEVYGEPTPGDLPLTESSQLRVRKPYALSKIAQESIALAYADRYELRTFVARSFNHTGPGQRPEFAVPAIARRVFEVAQGRADGVSVGNLDVKRDLSDVRDVTRAYRMLIEASLTADLGRGGTVLNVCSGKSVAIRWVAEELCRLAGIAPVLQVDPQLVRASDPPEIRGDYSLLEATTGWRPQRTLSETLRDVWEEVASRA